MGGKRGRAGSTGKAGRANKRAKSGSGGPARTSGGGGGGRRVGGRSAFLSAAEEAPTSSRKQAREEARHAHKQEKKKAGPQHGGEEAKDATRQRLRAKIIERKLSRLGDGSAADAERRALLLDLGRMRVEAGQPKQAVEAYQQLIKLDPEDAQFVRTPLLCLMMDQAMTQEASSLVQSKLFSTLLAQDSSHHQDAGFDAVVAALTGSYTLAVLTYISVRVLREHKRNSKAAAAAEKRLLDRLRAAFQRNPFAAEFLAFAPAFERHFPHGLALPDAGGCRSEELRLRQALEYCCGYGQASVWLDTDDEVRRFVRQSLFEKEEDSENPDQEPMGKLPSVAAGVADPPLIARWRRARRDALDLWASELAREGGIGSEDSDLQDGEEGEDEEDAADEAEEGEEGEEEPREEDSDASGSSGEAVAGAEERRGMG